MTEPRTPLTLEFAPETPDSDPSARPIIVVEPSFTYPGTIFVGAHPLGKENRLGVHLLPADAEAVRNHLSKLLTDPEDDPETPKEDIDWVSRIDAAVRRRIAKERRRKPLLNFRVEFQVGRIQGVFGTTHGR